MASNEEAHKFIVKGGGDNELWFNNGGQLMKLRKKKDFALIVRLICEPCKDVGVVRHSNIALRISFSAAMIGWK